MQIILVDVDAEKYLHRLALAGLSYTQANKNTAVWLGHPSDKQGSKSPW